MRKLYKTKRLRLNEISVNDAAFIKELVNTAGWIRFIGQRNIRTNDDAIKYIEKITSSDNIRYWLIQLHPGNIPVGVLSFIKRDYLLHNDIGFALLPEYQGNGYAFEAALEVLNDVQKNTAHQQVLATTLKDNINSIAVLKKLGFQFSHEINVEGENLLVHSILA